MIERSDIEKLSAISRFAGSRVSRTADWLAYQEAFQNAWPSLKGCVPSYCSRRMNWLTFSSAPDLEFCRLSRSCQSFVSSCQRKPAVPYPIPDQNGQSVFPFSDKIVPNSLSFGAAHAYIVYMGYGGVPPPPTGPDRPHDFTIPGSKIHSVSCERGPGIRTTFLFSLSPRV